MDSNRVSSTRYTGPLVTDTAELKEIDARNALLQFDVLAKEVEPEYLASLEWVRAAARGTAARGAC